MSHSIDSVNNNSSSWRPAHATAGLAQYTGSGQRVRLESSAQWDSDRRQLGARVHSLVSLTPRLSVYQQAFVTKNAHDDPSYTELVLLQPTLGSRGHSLPPARCLIGSSQLLIDASTEPEESLTEALVQSHFATVYRSSIMMCGTEQLRKTVFCIDVNFVSRVASRAGQTKLNIEYFHSYLFDCCSCPAVGI